MRLLLFLLLVGIGVSLAVARLLSAPGFVLIAWDDVSIEFVLFDFVLLLLAAFVLGYLLLRFLARLVEAPHRVRRRWRQLQRTRARRLFYDGLLELSQGRWAQAERLLLRSVWHHDTPLLGYLAAARAAHMQKAFDRRDDYLRRAIEADPGADVAVGLQQAELQLSRRQYEQALATLERLRELAPKHPYVLFLLARLHRQLGDWQALKALVADMRRLRGVPAASLDEADAEATAHLLEAAGAARDAEAVQRLWKELPRGLRRRPELIAVRVRALSACGQHELATDELLRALEREWVPALVGLLGELHSADPMALLDRAERWLEAHGNDADLLLALGRLALAAELWGKARRYLETAIDLRPTPLACRLLGELLERLGEEAQARACFRRGLALAAPEAPPALPPPVDAPISESPTLAVTSHS